MKKFVTVGAAAVLGAAGAAAAFFLDPSAGPGRRRAAVERVEQSATAVRRESANVLAMIGRDSGADHTTARVQELAAGVKSAGPITVRVDQGVVTLRGEVLSLADISGLAEQVAAIPGVIEVNNLLRLRAAS